MVFKFPCHQNINLDLHLISFFLFISESKYAKADQSLSRLLVIFRPKIGAAIGHCSYVSLLGPLPMCKQCPGNL